MFIATLPHKNTQTVVILISLVLIAERNQNTGFGVQGI